MELEENKWIRKYYKIRQVREESNSEQVNGSKRDGQKVKNETV